MKKIMNYVLDYKDKSFSEEPFNTIDSLILTQLVYVNFTGIITSFEQLSLRALGVKFFSKHKSTEYKKKDRFIKETYRLLEIVMHTKRFGNIMVTGYEKVVNQETQFGAITFLLPNGYSYIAFEGTDTSIVGWKEDFLMAYTYPVISQKLAVSYLKKSIHWNTKGVYVGGHSKGGNLAMASVMDCGWFKGRKVKAIYNFDGPGFRKREYSSKAYQTMLEKLQYYIPKESVFGLLLCHPDCYQVVNSDGFSVFQHDPFTWEVDKTDFKYTVLNPKSLKFSKDFFKFIEGIPDDERNKFITALFSVFEASGISDTEDLRLSKLNSCILLLKEIKNIDKATKDRVLKILKMFLKGIN